MLKNKLIGDFMSDNRKVFVGNVPFKCTATEFSKVFENERGFIRAELQTDQVTKTTKGFGFVEFESEDDVRNVLYKEFYVNNRALRLSEYKSKNSENRKIFVKDLEDASLEEFQNFFKRYGNVSKSYLITNRSTGESKGMGIIEFDTDKAYREALNDTDIFICGKKVSVFPFKDRYNEYRTTTKVETTNSYISGYNSGYATGFNTGFKEGYKKGFDDSKIGKNADPTFSYINKVITDIRK